MHYIEYAIGSTANRGHIVSLEQFVDILMEYGPKEDVFRSVYLYDDSIVSHVNNGGRIKDFYGPRYIDTIPIDIDKGDDTHENVRRRAASICGKLVNDGLDEFNFYVCYSGTGYHIHIAPEVFGFYPNVGDKELPYKIKSTIQSYFGGEADSAIYTRTALIRVEGSRSSKSGFFKTGITLEQLAGSVENIRRIASEASFEERELTGSGELVEFQVAEVPVVRSINTTKEPIETVPCIQKLYNQGPQRGTRNHSILRIASHARRNGIPSDFTKAGLLHWNDGQLENEVVNTKIEQVYRKGYMYGCNDWLLKENCNPKCTYFKRKDYMVDVKNAEDLHKDFMERMESDFTGRMLSLDKNFGLENEVGVYPGDMLTIFGPTGCNKTAIAQNIMLGYNAFDDVIESDLQIPTLFLSLELAGWYMHRRNLQIVNDMDKKTVNGSMKALWSNSKDKLSHVALQTVPPTMQQIQEKVRDIKPKLVIVDYAELLEPPAGVKGEYEQMRHACQKLRSLAVNEDIIVIMLSQVSREMSRSEALDLYAGKGSGAIENSSSHVLAINGSNKTPKRDIEMLKSSDGELFEKTLYWTPSFRIKTAEAIQRAKVGEL